MTLKQRIIIAGIWTQTAISLSLEKRNRADAERLCCSFLSLAHKVSIAISLWISTGRAAANGSLKKRRTRVPRNGDGVTQRRFIPHTWYPSAWVSRCGKSRGHASFSQPHLGGN